MIEKFKENLTPYFVEDKYKMRVGPPRDGGYVILREDLTPLIYSYGVGEHVPEAEIHLLQLFGGKCKIEMFDGTIEKCALEHPNVKFHQRNVYTFEDLSITQSNVNVFMDIEGCEFELFNGVEDLSVFDSIRQLSVEIHFSFIDKSLEEWNSVFEKLNEKFYLVHIHGNNHSSFDGFHGLPSVIEVTYVNKNSFLRPLTEKEFRAYPLRGFDAPCLLTKEDIPLTWWCE